MKTTVYLSRKLLNQLKVKETESKDLMLTHNLHNIIINGKRVGCSGHSWLEKSLICSDKGINRKRKSS